MTAKTHVVRLADVNSPVAQWQSGWLLTTRLAVRVRLGEPEIIKAVFLRRNGLFFTVKILFELATPVPSTGATGQADPHGHIQTIYPHSFFI